MDFNPDNIESAEQTFNPDNLEPAAQVVGFNPDNVEIVTKADKTKSSVLEKLGQSASAAPYSLAESAFGLEQAGTDIVAPWVDPALRFFTGDERASISNPSIEKRKRYRALAEAERPDTTGMSDFEAGAVNAPESFVQGIGAIGVGLAAGPGAALTAMGLVQGGQSYGEAKDANVDTTRALIHGAAQGIIEAGTEAIGLPGVLKGLTAKTGLLSAIAKYTAEQVVGEQVATFFHNLLDWARINPDKTAEQFQSEIIPAALQTLGGTLAQGTMHAPVIYGAGKLAGRSRSRREKEEEELTQQVMEQATEETNKELQRLMEEELARKSTGIMPDNPDPYINPHSDILPPSEQDKIVAERDVSAIPNDPLAMADAGDELTLMNRQEGFQQQEAAQDVNALTSEKVKLRRSTTELNTVPAGDRIIAVSTDPEDIGYTSNQRVQAPGTTRGIGGNTKDYSLVYMQAVVDTVQQWSEKLMPVGTRMVVNFNALDDTHVGAYQQLRSGVHVITPREITRAATARRGVPGEMNGTLQNFNTQAASIAFGGISHEFGHALTLAQFAVNMPEQFRNIVSQLNDVERNFTEQELAQMPALEAGVIREFLARRNAILSGQMLAEEFIESWAGPWKAGFDLMKKSNERSLYGFARDALNRVKDRNGSGKLVEGATALALLKALGHPKQYLQFEEYMAEQMSRYVHANRMEKGTPLGRYFQQAIKALQKFFKMLKVEGVIKPGVSFQEWVDAVAESRAMREVKAAKPVAVAKKARRIKKALVGLKEKKQRPREKAPTVVKMLELADTPEKAAIYRGRIKAALPPIPQRTLSEKQLGLELVELVNTGQYQAVEDALAEYVAHKPKYDVKGKGGNWEVGTEITLVNALFKSTGFEDSPEVLAWAKRAIRTYLLRSAGTKEDPLKDVVLRRDLEATPEVETWEEAMDMSIGESWQSSLQADGRAETVYRIGAHNPDTTSYWLLLITQRLAHVGDNMLAIPQKSLLKMTFAQVVLASEAMDAAAEKARENSSLEWVKSLEVVQQYSHNLVLVRLQKEGDFAKESAAMAHCVRLFEKKEALRQQPKQSLDGMGDEGNPRYSGGWAAIREGAQIVYSLKDSVTGEGLATIRVGRNARGGWNLEEIKGPRNGEVPLRGQFVLQEFVQDGDWVSVNTDDLNNISLVDTLDVTGYPGGTKYQLNTTLNKAIYDKAGKRYLPVTEFQKVRTAVVLEQVPQALELLKRKDIQEKLKDPGVYRAHLTALQAAQAEQRISVMSYAAVQHILTLELESNAGLRWDKTGAEAEEEKGQARGMMASLRRIGTAAAEVSWVATAMNKVSNLQYAVLQIQQLAHTETDLGLKVFAAYMNWMQEMKNKLLAVGQPVVEQLNSLSEKDAALLQKFIEKVYWNGTHVGELQYVNGVQQMVLSQGLLDAAKKEGIAVHTEAGQKLVQLYLDYNNSILYHIAVMESSAIATVREVYSRSAAIQRIKVAEIREAATKWRHTPFVPQGRHGKYVVKVFVGKDLIYKRHYDSVGLQEKAVRELQQRFTLGGAVQWETLSEATGFQMSLPTEFLDVLRDTSEFTEEQLNTIQGATLKTTTDKLFSKVARDATRIGGADPDMVRNYANFIEDNANFIAKHTYGRKMTSAIASTRGEERTAMQAGDIPQTRHYHNLADTMQRAKQNIMHPLDEFHVARSVVALTLLLYAPKTALMNLTGMIQTYAALTAEFGNVKGHVLFARAIKEASSGQVKGIEENWMLEEALKDGVIDQGYSYFMSGASNAGNLARRVRNSLPGKSARLFMDVGMLPFKTVEIANRKTTLLAFFRAELEKELERHGVAKGDRVSPEYGLARSSAYSTARERTTQLQNDYSAGNRPRIFQGKQSLFMIFMSYPQSMLWLMCGAYERGIRLRAKARGETPRAWFGGFTMRMWLIFFALSGGEGVPFGETLKELLQWLWNKFGKGENVNLEAQKFMRESLGVESAYWRMTIQKGLLYDVGGINLSGSFSLGSPLPGTRLLNSQTRNTNEFIGRLVKEFSGPFGGEVSGVAGLANTDDITLKVAAQNFPGAAGALLRAADAAKTGYTDAQGVRMLRDEGGQVRDANRWEIFATAMGFSLTEISQLRTERAVVRDQLMYWGNRSNGLKRHYLQAMEDGDLKEQEQIRAAVDEYNAEIPNRGLFLSGKDLNTYVKEHRRGVRKVEQDHPMKRARELTREMEGAYRKP